MTRETSSTGGTKRRARKRDLIHISADSAYREERVADMLRNLSPHATPRPATPAELDAIEAEYRKASLRQIRYMLDFPDIVRNGEVVATGEDLAFASLNRLDHCIDTDGETLVYSPSHPWRGEKVAILRGNKHGKPKPERVRLKIKHDGKVLAVRDPALASLKMALVPFTNSIDDRTKYRWPDKTAHFGDRRDNSLRNISTLQNRKEFIKELNAVVKAVAHKYHLAPQDLQHRHDGKWNAKIWDKFLRRRRWIDPKRMEVVDRSPADGLPTLIEAVIVRLRFEILQPRWRKRGKGLLPT